MAVTPAMVAKWGSFSLPSGEELALLERVIAATVEYIETNFDTSDPASDATEQAMIMQASRLWRRRQSLDGVAAFSNDFAIRVTSLDPDVRMLLTPSFVGFA